MKAQKQLETRVAYADRRRSGAFAKSKRVIWKSRSRHVA